MHKEALKNSRTLNPEESVRIPIKMFLPIQILEVLKLTDGRRDYLIASLDYKA